MFYCFDIVSPERHFWILASPKVSKNYLKVLTNADNEEERPLMMFEDASKDACLQIERRQEKRLCFDNLTFGLTNAELRTLVVTEEFV